MSSNEQKDKRPVAFLVFLLVVYGVLFAGYLGVRKGVPAWYDGLLHPAGAPAPWVFGPIWSLISLFIGFAGWQLWSAPKSTARRMALVLFGLQLVLNSFWAWLFFGSQRPGVALIDLGILWVAVFLNMLAAIRVRPTIGGLLVPYLLWVSFAGYLNYGIWSLNERNQQGVGRIETIVQ